MNKQEYEVSWGLSIFQGKEKLGEEHFETEQELLKRMEELEDLGFVIPSGIVQE